MRPSRHALGSRVWLSLDVILVTGFLWVSFTLPLHPQGDAPAHVYAALGRVLVTMLLLARVLARGLPLLLLGSEQLGIEVLVAARFLRAKKSGFLGAITALALLAVTVSSCALTTTLSVMGGFRTDLKRKILGNTPHIVAAPDHSNFEGWDPVLRIIRNTPGVVHAAPYLSTEVMISSATNLAGAVLKGMPPMSLRDSTTLAKHMRSGKLDYLEHPEKLLTLSPEERRGDPVPSKKAPSKEATNIKDSHAPSQAENRTLTIEPSEERIRDDTLKTFESPLPLEDPKEVLPGIIIGQELARSLRLFVSDEVNIVSPHGDLGPSGPLPKSRPFRVAGIFYSGMYEYDMKHVYMALKPAQDFLSVGDSISGIESRVSELDDAPAIAAKLRKSLSGVKGLKVRDWRELNKNLFGALALEKLAMFITLGIAILVASFCVISLLSLMVQEKGKGVAILKTLGATDRSIVGVFVLAGAFIGVFGAILGLSLGYSVCFLAEHFVLSVMQVLGFTQVSLAEVYYLDRLPVSMDPLEFTLVGVSSVIICVIVTIYPAILASRIRPVDALRES
ncbi:MAG: FtsX-like permease family protein [Myxococcales bacterium]|nr:FtsX-like permease family protein [Myxococcales bacterium]MCB9708346.1 FtsX-like permease family protein [Myxococcales bacterium]